MGITLHAIVEVQVEGRPGYSRWPRYWEDVSTWELNKNSELREALYDVTEEGWPGPRVSTGSFDSPEVTSARREADDIADIRRWATLFRLRATPPPEPDDEYAFRGRFLALLASCEELAKHYGGDERVRVLFYSIT